MKPCCVSQMTSGGRTRTTLFASWRMTSIRRAVAVLAGDLARLLRRLDSVERDDAPLDLRDRLLRDDDDVAVLELDPLDDQRREVVALAQLRDAGRRAMTRDSRSRQAGDADAGVALVAPVQVDDHRRHPLERARARERAGVERAAGDDLARRARARAPSRRASSPQTSASSSGRPCGERRGRERVETGDDRASRSSCVRSAIERCVLGRDRRPAS